MTRILVVDDEPQLRGVLSGMLEAAGHAVVEACDGEEVVRAFQAHQINVLVCDLFMPNRDGLELIRTVHRELPGVRVVAMIGGTGIGSCDLMPIARFLGA